MDQLTNAGLTAMLAEVQQQERRVREHLVLTKDSAGEQARGLAVYRHAVAARRALEDWIATRTYRASQPVDV